MSPSRHLTAAPRLNLRTTAPMAALSAAVCLAAVACRGPAASAGAAYGTASAAAPTATTPAAPAKALLTVRKTGAGYVLATSTGRTIYWYSADIKGSGKSTCTGTCLAAWPAVEGAPAAAPGVQLAGQLGTITRPGGVVQATYNGYPLYTYAQDMAPGQTTGNGVTGAWHVITGAVLSPSPSSAAAASLRDASPAASATPAAAPAATASGYGGY
jgi:predicted lipoprotein with Yx(FWY)xxD motif